MRRLHYFLTLPLISLSILAMACAPRPAPPPASSPTAPPPQAIQSAPPAPSPEDIAWQKLVAAAKKEGRVTLYSFGFTADVGRAVAKAFEEKYAIKVEFVTGVGSVLIERMKSEKAAGKQIADTLDTSSALVLAAKRGGLTDAAGKLPVLQEKVWHLPPQLDSEGHAINYGVSYYAIYTNTTLVKAGDEPKSWKDLLDPKWKEKVIIDSPVTSPMWPRIYYIMVEKNKALEKDYLSRLAANKVRVVPTVRDVPVTLSRGELPIGVTQSIMANPLITEGAPIKPFIPAEGTILLGGPTIAVAKDAPHPNAARLFVNWLLTQEGQKTYASARAVISIRTDVDDFSPPVARVKLGKTFYADEASETEVDKLQASGQIAEIFGLKK